MRGIQWNWPDVYDREGADELVFYDITASADGRDIVMNLVQQVSEQVFIPLTVGGGHPHLRRCAPDSQGSPPTRLSINSGAVRDPDIIRQGSESFGSQCIVGGYRRQAEAGDGCRFEQ